MKILSIIPVKDLNYTKTRLRPILELDGRQALTLQILARTIRILKSSEKIQDIMVMSPDLRVLSFAKRCGVLGMSDEEIGLNKALQRATDWSLDHFFDAILILPSDLPYIQKEDIEAIISLGSEEAKTVVLSPDNERQGTNALFMKPPGNLTYFFGKDSFIRHQDNALSRQLQLKVYSSLSMGFDLDSPKQYLSFLGKKCTEGGYLLQR